MKISLSTILGIVLISTLSLANPLGTSIEIDSITRPHLPSMKLDLMAFASGLDNIDENHWCDSRTNNSDIYTKAFLEDIKNLEKLSVTPEDVDTYKKVYSNFFELCKIADADEFIERDFEKYVQDFEFLESLRNALIEELPQ